VTPTPGDAPLAPSVVMPASNEEAVIVHVVSAWLADLARLGMSCELRVCDDGATDGVGELFAKEAEAASRL